MAAGGRDPARDRAIQNFSESTDRIRQDLYYCDVSFTQRSTRELRANVHAASYVYAAAAIERFVNDLLVAVINEISAALITLNKLRLSLFALLETPRFESLKQVRGLKMWQKRGEVFASLELQTSCLLSEEHLPLDGRTIRREHLETIWAIFGLTGLPAPSPLHEVALSSLADARNKVAHGEERASVVAGQTSITDTLKLLDRLDEIALHLWDKFTDYLTAKEYMR